MTNTDLHIRLTLGVDGSHLTVDVNRLPVIGARNASFALPLVPDDEEKLDEAGDPAAQLARRFSEIPGIVGVGLEPYLINIRKAALFEWTDMLPQIIDGLQAAFNVGRVDISYYHVAGRPSLQPLDAPGDLPDPTS